MAKREAAKVTSHAGEQFAAKVTRWSERSEMVELGVALIKGTGMPFAEVDLGDHIAAVTVYGGTQVEADQRAARLAAGWNLLNGADNGKA